MLDTCSHKPSWRERREAVPWLWSAQLLLTAHRLSLWGFLPPPRGPWARSGDILVVSRGDCYWPQVWKAGALFQVQKHTDGPSQSTVPPEGWCKGESLPSGATFPSTLGLGGGVWLAGLGLEGPGQGCQPPPESQSTPGPLPHPDQDGLPLVSNIPDPQR